MNFEKKLKKLDIPEPGTDLEDKILNAATPQQKFLPKIAVMAACFAIILTVWNEQPTQSESATEIDLLADIEFIEDEYDFVEDLT